MNNIKDEIIKLELISISKKIITNFINNLEYDGEYYASSIDIPVILKDNFSISRYLSPESSSLFNFLTKLKENKKVKDEYYQNGLIILPKNYLNEENFIEGVITLIHEYFHSQRDILSNSLYQELGYTTPLFYINNVWVKVDDSELDYIGDASQEILRVNYDNSSNISSKYSNLSYEEKLNYSEKSLKKINELLELQTLIDEDIIELMSILAYRLYKNNNNYSIYEELQFIKSKYDNKSIDKGINYLCNIILSHNNLDIFSWMIDPLGYQIGDPHFNYLKHYLSPKEYKKLTYIKKKEQH